MNLRSANRIVGGAFINITSIPFMISIMLKGQHMCGGGILDEFSVITAGHCAQEVVGRIHDVQVRSGSSYEDEGGIIHNVTKITVHENYNPDTNDYDIAVLKVNPPFKYDNSTQSLTIAKNESTDSDFGLIAGWGYFLDFDPVLSRQLQFVLLPKVQRDECEKDYANEQKIVQTQVCYGFRNGGKDACKGDSGGPIVNMDHVLIGVTSWGDGCAEAGKPGVYTDAILLRDWIKKQIEKD
ncbi:hypothetical protein HZH66_008299 [Vespula vulgaris]|uniref:Chymotrypsin-2 n=1 Tax=Vespula vulgaris TaxID=7454 RepID=A0A834JVZ0_VESVU|nr:hypothetical protein HZH66_008299 [Vespula vulgaris]